jgi:hypothetical protein
MLATYGIGIFVVFVIGLIPYVKYVKEKEIEKYGKFEEDDYLFAILGWLVISMTWPIVALVFFVFYIASLLGVKV